MNRRVFLRRLGMAGAWPWMAAAWASRLPAQVSAASVPLVRVLSCNIRQTIAADAKTGDGWEDRRELCRDILLKQQADILCFQESRLVQLDYFEEKLPGFTRFGIGNPPPAGQPVQPGNAILFSPRFRLLDSGGFWLSETPEVPGSKSWDSAAIRYLNWVHLRDTRTQRELQVWNTHLDHVSQPARVGQTRVALAAMEKVPASRAQVLAADFNADVQNEVHHLLAAAGWVETYAAVHGPADPGFTFHRFLGPEFPKHTPPERVKGKIDFVYSRGPWRVRDAAVIRDSRHGRFPSDHYFVSADLEFS